MSQGSAHLTVVRLPADAALDTSESRPLRCSRGVVYLSGFSSATRGSVGPKQCPRRIVWLLIRRLSQALAETVLPVAELKAIDTYVQKILLDISPLLGLITNVGIKISV